MAELYSAAASPRVASALSDAEAEPEPDGETPVRSRHTPDFPNTFASTQLAAHRLSQILDLVRDIPGGTLIHRDAVQLLDELQRSCEGAEQYFSGLVDLLLHDLARRSAANADVRTEFELLRRHLRPPFAGPDPALRERLEALLDDPSGQLPSAVMEPNDHSGASLSRTDEGPRSRHPVQPRTHAPALHGDAGADGDDANADQSLEDTEIHESKIDGLQQSLGREIRETLSQNEEFGVTLDLVLSELKRVREIGDAENIRRRLTEQVKRLHSGHFALAQKLDSADRYLRMLTMDSRNLNEELHRVRELSLTDELTSLPNRRAFMARVEEEVARVERYGMPLSLALIDLDRFKLVNDQHGHAAGDEVLRCYATQIFSVFRNHDLVARYGGEEFAVLLPNTDHGGAAAALRKARECAARVRSRAQDTAFPVPTFSAGVATFERGETAKALIDRADEALYRAKRGGRDRVEFSEGAKPRS